MFNKEINSKPSSILYICLSRRSNLFHLFIFFFGSWSIRWLHVIHVCLIARQNEIPNKKSCTDFWEKWRLYLILVDKIRIQLVTGTVNVYESIAVCIRSAIFLSLFHFSLLAYALHYAILFISFFFKTGVSEVKRR